MMNLTLVKFIDESPDIFNVDIFDRFVMEEWQNPVSQQCPVMFPCRHGQMDIMSLIPDTDKSIKGNCHILMDRSSYFFSL